MRLSAEGFSRLARVFALGIIVILASPVDAYQPILHLRKTATPPPLVTKLQDPATASAWYSSSPMWFGMGGLTVDRNHTEVLATYDDTALYVAFLDIDRETVLYPKNTATDITTVDSDGIWIETPAGRRFYFHAALDTSYPPLPKQASGEFPSFDPKSDKLPGWAHAGWFGGDKAIEQTIRIPWSAMSTSAPVRGSRWRANFVNYNQTSTTISVSTVRRQMWAPGDQNNPAGWGILAFDEAEPAPTPDISPEATLTLRPGTGAGEEITLRAGNGANLTNEWTQEAITQSNWNDSDPIDYTIKEYLQFDLSMIPPDRKIISATLKNHFRGHFQSGPTDQYLHVVRLDGAYDPKAVTMLTSPLPVENGFRRLVQVSEVGNWIDFDVTDAVRSAFESGQAKTSFALAGSSGDIHNGKIWNISSGRADWYDARRPRLVVTFGRPGVSYEAPVLVGSTNNTSVATAASKNKLTNGTFRYGVVEGITNTTYWSAEPAFVYINGQNIPLMQMRGDINPKSGDPALRFAAESSWKQMKQYATGISGGKAYTFSGWFKGSASGIKASVALDFFDANGTDLGGSGMTSYGGSAAWEQLKVTRTAPAGTAKALITVQTTTSASGAYLLYSDFQFEEGSAPTAYSETIGIYYPDHPRAGGTFSPTENNCIGKHKNNAIDSTILITDRTVTASWPTFFYIQCPEEGHPACGIKVISGEHPAVGSKATVAGILTRDSNDELAIGNASVTTSSGGAMPRVFGCGNSEFGGVGIDLTGVLQTTWGRVSGLVSGILMDVDDGGGAPVRVVGPTGAAANGAFVRVMGIASFDKSSGAQTRMLRTRSNSDVQVMPR